MLTCDVAGGHGSYFNTETELASLQRLRSVLISHVQVAPGFDSVCIVVINFLNLRRKCDVTNRFF